MIERMRMSRSCPMNEEVGRLGNVNDGEEGPCEVMVEIVP